MKTARRMVRLGIPLIAMAAGGCAAPKVDFSKIKRPARPAELDACDVFVGSWNWDARMLNAEEPYKKWTGTATWRWTLENRCLHGQIAANSGDTHYETAGIWTCQPESRKYIWWMFNNWGYPQQGTADYDRDTKTWTMPYRSVGLDGTPSYGRYEMKVVDNDTLEWRLDEWADILHLFKKMEMEGTYRRAK